MRTKWIAALAGVAALAGATLAATVVVGDQTETLPPYATVEVEMRGPAATPATGRVDSAAKPNRRKRPKVLYFSGQGEVDVAATGPYVDVKLEAQRPSACPRVVDGGVQAATTDIYQQGTRVGPGRGEYHVLIGFEDETAPASFTFTSHLICLKGVR